MAEKGRGTIFERWNGSSYDEVLGITSVAGGGVTADTIETTELNPADAFRTFMSGLKSGEEVSLGFNLDSLLTTADAKNQGLLKGDVEGDVNVQYRITFVSGANVVFTAVATAFTVGDVNAEGKIEGSASFQPSGKPTWADA